MAIWVEWRVVENWVESTWRLSGVSEKICVVPRKFFIKFPILNFYSLGEGTRRRKFCKIFTYRQLPNKLKKIWFSSKRDAFPPRLCNALRRYRNFKFSHRTMESTWIIYYVTTVMLHAIKYLLIELLQLPSYSHLPLSP